MSNFVSMLDAKVTHKECSGLGTEFVLIMMFTLSGNAAGRRSSSLFAQAVINMQLQRQDIVHAVVAAFDCRF